MERVMKLRAESPVVIFTKSSCCMSHTIQTLIHSFGANPRVSEVNKLPTGMEMEKALVELGCKPTVPAVLIGKEFVGGSDEIMSLNLRDNKLKQFLIRANAIWV